MRIVRVELHIVPVHEDVKIHVGKGHLMPFLRLIDDGSVFEMFHLIVESVLELEPREHPVLEREFYPGLHDIETSVRRRMELHRRVSVR